jgi:hypothetical protein
VLQAGSGRSIDPKKDGVSVHFSVPSGNEEGIHQDWPGIIALPRVPLLLAEGAEDAGDAAALVGPMACPRSADGSVRQRSES